MGLLEISGSTPGQPATQPSIAPADMVFISSGSLWMGSTPEQLDQLQAECLAEQSACREHSGCSASGSACEREIFARQLGGQRIEVASFYIDRIEVSNARYAHWLNSLNSAGTRVTVTHGRWVWYEGQVQLLDLIGSESGIAFQSGVFVARPDRAELPVVQITWDGAQRFCADHGKTLPREAQWEWVARGVTGRRYPWGDRWTKADCSRIALARSPGMTCGHLEGASPVGTSPGDRTPEGVLDFGGNVAEWTHDRFRQRYASDFSGGSDAHRDSELDYRSIRGGFFDGMSVFARGNDRSRLERNRGANNLGFRCALSAPEP